MLQEARRRLGDAWVAALPPHGDPGADLVDEFILLNPILSPLGVEFKLFPSFLRLWDGYKVGANATGLDRLVRNTFVGELEVPSGFGEGGVENGVFNDDVGHDFFSLPYRSFPVRPTAQTDPSETARNHRL